MMKWNNAHFVAKSVTVKKEKFLQSSWKYLIGVALNLFFKEKMNMQTFWRQNYYKSLHRAGILKMRTDQCRAGNEKHEYRNGMTAHWATGKHKITCCHELSSFTPGPFNIIYLKKYIPELVSSSNLEIKKDFCSNKNFSFDRAFGYFLLLTLWLLKQY